jgi:glycine/D-amino acid oxidase-like deaminating enzyme
MDMEAKVLIIGGGIWGLSTAFHLARSGETDVVVLERNQEPFGETASLQPYCNRASTEWNAQDKPTLHTP